MKDTSRPVIGVLGVPVYDDEKFEVIALYEDYRKTLIAKNCIPYMIIPVQNINYLEAKEEEFPELTEKEKEMYKEMVDMCDGIILPGGYRVYNFHRFIINYAIERNIPILGTCLGMQALAYNDNGCECLLKDETETHRKRGEKYVHSISIVPNTLLSEIIGEEEIQVNSIHRYYVSKVKDFIVSAYASDGKIEAIELPGKDFVLGVQWHPEKMISYDLNANKIIDRFISECIKKK